jgi:hypothetical protein
MRLAPTGQQEGFDAMHENRVIVLLCAWLSSKGYEIIRYTQGTQQGDDILARGQNSALFKIECKGSTNQEGREFTSYAKYQNVASAFFNQVTLREREPQSEIGIAFPDDNGRLYGYRDRMKPLRAVCERNRLQIFWVSENSVSAW